MGTMLVNRNFEKYIYHSCVHVSLLLHSQSFVQEYDWMTSKMNDNSCVNHSLKDHVHDDIPIEALCSLLVMSNKCKFYA